MGGFHSSRETWATSPTPLNIELPRGPLYERRPHVSKADQSSKSDPPKRGPSLKSTGKARTEVAPRESEPNVDAAEIPKDAYVVSLPSFEGPLDLLLQIIQKHELNILDIPISFITEKYLAYLKVMQSLSIDLASEYLVMAATLAHIKSKMLLPELPSDQEDENAEEEIDPREELVRRLLEYQKYKAAAEDLGTRDALGRDVFQRGMNEDVPDGPAPFAKLGVFELLDAFSKLMERSKVKIEHEIVFDRISISDRINQLCDVLRDKRSLPFDELFPEAPTRFDLIITFLALLEMCRLNMLRVFQVESLSPIHLELLIVTDDDEPLALRSQPPPPRSAALSSDDANAPMPSAEVEMASTIASEAVDVAASDGEVASSNGVAEDAKGAEERLALDANENPEPVESESPDPSPEIERVSAEIESPSAEMESAAEGSEEIETAATGIAQSFEDEVDPFLTSAGTVATDGERAANGFEESADGDDGDADSSADPISDELDSIPDERIP
jgi:segregation and condensation protein A